MPFNAKERRLGAAWIKHLAIGMGFFTDVQTRRSQPLHVVSKLFRLSKNDTRPRAVDALISQGWAAPDTRFSGHGKSFQLIGLGENMFDEIPTNTRELIWSVCSLPLTWSERSVMFVLAYYALPDRTLRISNRSISERLQMSMKGVIGALNSLADKKRIYRERSFQSGAKFDANTYELPGPSGFVETASPAYPSTRAAIRMVDGPDRLWKLLDEIAGTGGSCTPALIFLAEKLLTTTTTITRWAEGLHDAGKIQVISRRDSLRPGLWLPKMYKLLQRPGNTTRKVGRPRRSNEIVEADGRAALNMKLREWCAHRDSLNYPLGKFERYGSWVGAYEDRENRKENRHDLSVAKSQAARPFKSDPQK